MVCRSRFFIISPVSSLDCDAADGVVIAIPLDLNVGCNGLLEAFDMANDAHTATADVIEAIECFHHFPEVIITE